MLLQRRVAHWHCQHCAEVVDETLELHDAQGRLLARWQRDGHFATEAPSDHEVEFGISRRLGVPFASLEALRSQRLRSGEPALGSAFTALLARYGHTLEQDTKHLVETPP